MRIAFLRGPLGPIDPDTETSILLMYECYLRGHRVLVLQSSDLYVRDNAVVGRMKQIIAAPGLSLRDYWKAATESVAKKQFIFAEIAELDALFLREDPPLLLEVMELLASVEDRVLMINGLAGQLFGNSKLYILNFPEIIPDTHVSRDPARLRKVIDDFGGNMVMKPLNGFGGQGVIKVSAREPENLNSLLNFYVRAHEPYARREPVMVQEYLEAVRNEGDVRILLLNGEVLGAMRRLPHGADFRANIQAGGEAFAHDLTPAEQNICAVIRERLVHDELHFVGIDVIDGKLIEVNCVSPGGIPRINRFNRTQLEKRVINFIERKVAARNNPQSSAVSDHST